MTPIELVKAFGAALKNQDLSGRERIVNFFGKTIEPDFAQHKDPLVSTLKEVFEKTKTDLLFHKLFCLLLDYCMFSAYFDINDRSKYSEFVSNFKNRYAAWHYFDNFHANDEMIFDLPALERFPDDQRRQQFPLGKPNKASKKVPYAPHQLMPMGWDFFSHDAPDYNGPGTTYFGSGKKTLLDYFRKQWYAKTDYKVRERQTDTTVILERNIDAKNNGIPPSEYMYVLTQKGSLYIASHKEIEGTLHHSSFRAGQYVGCAGWLVIDKNGKISQINAESGHMKPLMENLITAVIWLYEDKKFIEKDCIVNFRGDYMLDANGGAIDSISVAELINRRDLVYNYNPELDAFRVRNKSEPSHKTTL